MKKIFSIIVVVCMGMMLYAGPPHHHHHGHHVPPPPSYRVNNGVRLAADIVGLVGAGLSVLRPPVVYTPGYGYYNYNVAPVIAPPCAEPAPPAYAVPQVIPPPAYQVVTYPAVVPAPRVVPGYGYYPRRYWSPTYGRWFVY